MTNKFLHVIIIISLFISAIPSQALAQTGNKIISLTESIGADIDQNERQKYHLFPDIKGFKSAVIEKISENKYRINFVYEDYSGQQRISRVVPEKAIELTRLHIKLADQYDSLKSTKKLNSDLEAQMLYRLALRYASQRNYKISSLLMKDLVTDYSHTEFSDSVKKYYPRTNRLWKTKEALFWEGSLLDQSGRTELLIFSGYYGLWIGIATPIAFKAESSQAYALGLLFGGPFSVWLASSLTKTANISDAKATLISLGGHLGAWQGVGWGIIGNMEGNSVVGLSEICGLGGILGATIVANNLDFTSGQAEITSSGLQWGAWFGLVLANLADMKGDNILRSMLIGSDAFILGGGLLAKDVQMSRTRVRLINLSGILGAVFGFGLDLLLEVDDPSTGFAIAGLGSVAGLAIGTKVTRNLDKSREFSLFNGNGSKLGINGTIRGTDWSLSPRISLKQHPAQYNRLLPTIGLKLSF